MEHNLFKPKGLEEAKHAAVGDCNGFTMQERWEKETPEFARAILRLSPVPQENDVVDILDYGCGPGRLAKEVLNQAPNVRVWGTDASIDMLKQAKEYVNSEKFNPEPVSEIVKHEPGSFDLVYCVYVLQHCPAIDLRDVIRNIYNALKDDGVFVYCSSDYRMAIRFDGGGFFSDNFLGVNIREEIEKLFDVVSPLFSDEIFNNNPVVKKMVTGCEGGLPHPAFVYKKKKVLNGEQIKEEFINYNGPTNEVNREISAGEKEIVKSIESPQESCKVKDVKKLLLVNRLAPGDILVMTNALRDLHKAYPGKYQTDINTPCDAIFENNPYVTKLEYDRNEFNLINNKFSSISSGDMSKESRKAWLGDILVVDMHYPLINRSGAVGAHFGEGHRDFLSEILGISIKQTEIKPEIYFSQAEKDWVGPLITKKGIKSKYWVINAGSKGDYTLKQYPYYQEVINLMKDKLVFVQVGQKEHNHKALDGVVDMLGQTTLRELFRLIYHSQGVISCVSLHMHIAAAFYKPCVVVAGAREGTRWELYPNHQFLYVNGCLPCASYDGCWKSKPEECKNKVNNIPRCMTLITPQDISRAVERYYQGNMLTY